MFLSTVKGSVERASPSVRQSGFPLTFEGRGGIPLVCRKEHMDLALEATVASGGA
jgi:hypothetical protein